MQRENNKKNEYYIVREYCGKYSCEELIQRIIKNQLYEYQNSQKNSENTKV